MALPAILTIILITGLLALDAYWPRFSLFGKTLSRGRSSGGKVIALTFDDGPSAPATARILEVLERFGVKATFFMLGANCVRHPDLVRRVQAAGHVIGNHTFSHRKLVFAGPQTILDEITQWEEVVGDAPLPGPKLFRAPHGFKNPWLPTVLKRKGYHLIGWTRGIWDTDDGVDPDLLFRRATKNIRPGEVLLLHDGKDTSLNPDRSATVAVLPRLIEFYRQAGYRFVTIPEILKTS